MEMLPTNCVSLPFGGVQVLFNWFLELLELLAIVKENNGIRALKLS